MRGTRSEMGQPEVCLSGCLLPNPVQIAGSTLATPVFLLACPLLITTPESGLPSSEYSLASANPFWYPAMLFLEEIIPPPMGDMALVSHKFHP